MRGQRDVRVFSVRLETGDVTTVESFEHLSIDLTVSDLIEQLDEAGIRLTEDMLQFDRHHLGSSEGETAEEVRRYIMRPQEFPVFRFDDRRQLVQVADHEQLHAAESARVVTVAAKHVVHGIEQVCPNHADLVDHEQVKSAEQLDFVARKTPLVIDLPGQVGKVQSCGQLKKRMQRHTASINCGDTGRCR